MRYGYYKENGKVKYKQLPDHILHPKKKRKKKMGDYCKLDTNIDCHCVEEDVQAVEFENMGDDYDD